MPLQKYIFKSCVFFFPSQTRERQENAVSDVKRGKNVSVLNRIPKIVGSLVALQIKKNDFSEQRGDVSSPGVRFNCPEMIYVFMGSPE